MTKNIIYTSRAVCLLHNLTVDTLKGMVASGIANPRGYGPDKWIFSTEDYERIEVAAGYLHYLDLEPPAAAIALELFQDLQHVRENMS